MKVKFNENNGTGVKYAALLVVLFYLISISTYSQTASADFSGTWAFNETKSNQGEGGFRIAAQKLVITQDANNLSLERTRVRQSGEEIKTNEKYTLDGKESINPVFNTTTRKSSVNWAADKKSLTISSTMAFDMNGETTEIKSVEVWKLADANKSLIIELSYTSSQGEMKASLYYDKK